MNDRAAWGIAPGYEDTNGAWRPTSPATAEALLEIMGAEGEGPPPGTSGDDPGWVVAEGEAVTVEGRWTLCTEDGAEEAVEGALPPGLGPGYHQLRREEDGRLVRLIVTPGACYVPTKLHGWGWAAQLYAVRSGASWGMGDLGDLRRLGRWSADQGAAMMLVNPLHAALPTGPQQPSPYSPSSRCFHNPLYLRVEDVPGASSAEVHLDELAAAGRALNSERRIDRDAVWRLKLDALERLWKGSGDEPSFRRYCDEEGPALARYATFCALSEEHGAPWWDWPAGLRDADGADVQAFADAHGDRVRFHQWLQWLVAEQLAAAGAQIDLVQDLAVGVDAAGADAWVWRDCFAHGARVGAPPDEFNSQGQDWGLLPFDPWRLRTAGFEPFIRTVRAGFRHAGGMRFDHVMGLFRLFWIPLGRSPADGAYVRYPSRELLGILALESHRAQAYVVGEDLGTVEDSVREELRARQVLSYRLLWFEPSPPRDFPRCALAAVTTHDLPTVAGLWSGLDLAEQDQLDLKPNHGSTARLRQRLRDWTGVADDAPPEEVVAATYGLLAEAPSALLAATLDDAIGVPERPNMPGTTDERPNWSLALPKALEDIEADPAVAALATTLDRRPPPPADPAPADS
ncbi:MAG: 4-alpha-glucanotransferase [Actinomycetota bacterium]|nr:4-alpha-glucanotransferase [Actinomycetota bacterium]